MTEEFPCRYPPSRSHSRERSIFLFYHAAHVHAYQIVGLYYGPCPTLHLNCYGCARCEVLETALMHTRTITCPCTCVRICNYIHVHTHIMHMRTVTCPRTCVRICNYTHTHKHSHAQEQAGDVRRQSISCLNLMVREMPGGLIDNMDA